MLNEPMKPSVRNGTWYATLGPRQHVDFART
jgi:hypothetical protein